MPCKGVRDAFYRGIGGIPYCRTRHPLHSCKVSERQKPGRIPPATKSLDFFEDFSRFSAHPSHNLLKSLCTKGKTNVRDVFYPSQIPHKSLTSSLTSCSCSPKRIRWQEWERTYSSLTPAQYIFLILQDDLHYDDDTIAQMLAVKPASLRTLRSRLKGRER